MDRIVDDRVVLIDPLAIIDGRKALFLRDNFGGEVPLSCPYPPLELAFTAAVLRRDGIPVELIAANVLDLPHPVVVERLRKSPPRLVMFQSAWGSIDDDFALMRLLRDALPRTILAIAGPNVTATPERVLRACPLDAVILGEPEEAVLLMARGDRFSTIPNLAFLEGGEMVTTERRPPPGWASYPLPARDLLDLSRYTIPFSRRLPCTTIATVRGCPHHCTFCPTQIWNKREVRPRPVDLVLTEIGELVTRYRMRELNFRDDTFTWSHERVAAISEGILAAGHDLTWRCFATASTVTEDLLQLMAAAGCTQVCFGFESGDDAVLSKTGKGTTVAQGHQATAWARAAGLEVSGTFIVGLEGDNRQSIDKSIAFAIDNELDYVQVNVAAPMPTTAFRKRQDKAGLNADPDHFRWSGARTSETRELGAAQLPEEARRFYREFYLRPRYIRGRLGSHRNVASLLSHARLGVKMARHALLGG